MFCNFSHFGSHGLLYVPFGELPMYLFMQGQANGGKGHDVMDSDRAYAATFQGGKGGRAVIIIIIPFIIFYIVFVNNKRSAVY